MQSLPALTRRLVAAGTLQPAAGAQSKAGKKTGGFGVAGFAAETLGSAVSISEACITGCTLRAPSPQLFQIHAAATMLCARPQQRASSDLAVRGVDAVAAGPGGHCSAAGMTATIFGCTGFLGRYVAQALGNMGVRLVLPYRCDDTDMQHLRTMGDLVREGAGAPGPHAFRKPAGLVTG